MGESQVENGVVEQCSRSAHSKCIASRANCTFSESDAKPNKKKSANLELDVRYKPKFNINNISGGKFNLKLSRSLVLEEGGGGKSEMLEAKGKIEHKTDGYIMNTTKKKLYSR